MNWFRVNPSSLTMNRRGFLRTTGVALTAASISNTQDLHSFDLKDLNFNLIVDSKNFFSELKYWFEKIKKADFEDNQKMEYFVLLANTFARQITRVFPNDHAKQSEALYSIQYYKNKLDESLKLDLENQIYIFNKVIYGNYLCQRGVTLEQVASCFDFDPKKLELISVAKRVGAVSAAQVKPLAEMVKYTELEKQLENKRFFVYTVNREDLPCLATIEEDHDAMLINLKDGDRFNNIEEYNVTIANEAVHLFLRQVYGNDFNKQPLDKKITAKANQTTIYFDNLFSVEEFLSDAASIIQNPLYLREVLEFDPGRYAFESEQRYKRSHMIAFNLFHLFKKQYKDAKYLDPSVYDQSFTSKLSEETKKAIRDKYIVLARKVIRQVIELKNGKGTKKFPNFI